ncbi:MAG: TonB-dependent vitamin B12 receptor [Halothiobacillaceae bacterium]|nr:MAG: TonB-dependent vitamin B12 receptor [Halothiobacillaceae bacterium]
MKKIALSTAIAAVIAPSFALAADQLDNVQVTATRTAQTVDEALAPVTVITRADIERTQAATVAEALRVVPGLFVSSNGGAGKTTSIFLRGTESDHVLVLIDGVKVGSATSDTTPFENLPIELIDRIEVVRGPRSSLYGSEAIGGVIQIFTRRGGGKLTPSFSVAAGSDNTFKGAASLAGGGKDSWFNASLSGMDTDGFNACNGKPSPGGAGCFTYEPDRDGYEERAGSLRLGTRFGAGHSIEAFTLRSDGRNLFDGSFQNESETTTQTLGARLNLKALQTWGMGLQVAQSRDESDNFKDGIYSSTFDTRRDSASWQNDLQIGKGQLLTLGLDWQHDQVESSDLQSWQPDFQGYAVTERDNRGLFAQYQGSFGAHDLQAALRHDDNEQFGDKATGNLNWGYALGSGLRLTAGLGTAFKAPTFNELYYPGFGHAGLTPEESRSIEAGLQGKGKFGHWGVQVFQTRIDDLIAYNAATFSPDNIDEARILGLEGSLGTRVAGFDMNAALTLLDPENRSTGANEGNTLPRRARESLSLDIDRSLGVWSIGGRLYAAGKRYDDLANTVELDPYATLDLRAEYRLQRDWRLQAKVTNLFDAEYETAAWYNQQGRAVLVTLRYQPVAR